MTYRTTGYLSGMSEHQFQNHNSNFHVYCAYGLGSLKAKVLHFIGPINKLKEVADCPNSNHLRQ